MLWNEEERKPESPPLYSALYAPEDNRLLGYADQDGTQVVWFEYQDGRISAIRDSSGQRVDYGYQNGRLHTVSNPQREETVTFQYDANHERIVTVTYADTDPDTEGYSTRYVYQDGRLSQTLDGYGQTIMQRIYAIVPGSGETSCRLWKVTDAKNQTTEYGYDSQSGRLTTISYHDGRTMTLSYEAAGNSVLDLSYQYDTLGNIKTKETEHGLYDYDYDAMSRLTAADNPTLDDEAYSYDAVGNR